MLLQKGGDFMTLIKTPFKKKRSTIAGDEKRSQSLTPKSARGSAARSNSLGSSVNSYEESEVFVNNMDGSSKNIYADIDNADEGVECAFVTNNVAVTPPDLPAENPTPRDRLNILRVPTISQLENFEECVEEDFYLKPNLNGSTNNLLLMNEELMTVSIDRHLDNIDVVIENIDNMMQVHHQVEDKREANAKKSRKEKTAEKIKIMKDARTDGPGTSKDSLKSRVRNMFTRFERQGSGQDDEIDDRSSQGSDKICPIYDRPGPGSGKVAAVDGKPSSSGDEKSKKFGMKFLSSFKQKHTVVDETDEVFEEIKKVPSEIVVTDFEDTEMLKCAEEAENVDSKVHDNDGKLSSRFKSKFKSAKHLVTSKITKKPLKFHPKTCRKCEKKSRFSSDGVRLHHSRTVLDFNVVDNDFCVCVDVDDDFDDDGICIKNFEFKGVSCCVVAIWHENLHDWMVNTNPWLD